MPAEDASGGVAEAPDPLVELEQAGVTKKNETMAMLARMPQ
jgi:hypothetical protein